jgi:hypothetical protein
MSNENLSKSAQKITRYDTCPCFSKRKSILAIEKICWFCRFAGFDLKDDKLPEQGICLYPANEENSKQRGNTDEE